MFLCPLGSIVDYRIHLFIVCSCLLKLEVKLVLTEMSPYNHHWPIIISYSEEKLRLRNFLLLDYHLCSIMAIW